MMRNSMLFWEKDDTEYMIFVKIIKKVFEKKREKP